MTKAAGARLVTALKARRYTQADLARAAGVSNSYVWEIWCGNKAPSERLLRAAAALAEVDYGWLLNGGDTTQTAGTVVAEVASDCESTTELVARVVADIRELESALLAAHRGPLFDLLAEVLRAHPQEAGRIQGYLEALLEDVRAGDRRFGQRSA